MRRGKKKFNFKEEYSESWKFLKLSKNFIFVAIGIFLIFGIIGFFIPAPEEISLKIFEFIQELLAKTQGMNQRELVGFIFLNNLQSSFLGLVLGIFFGIFPFLALLSNGYILGFVASISVELGGFSSLWRLVPHGIFELPAIFISSGLGLKFGSIFFQKEKLKSFKEYFYNSLRIFLLIIIPLLIIAAIIEGILIFLG